ncbi:CIS tube protein [Streptomyces lavendulae]|uniref:CIS tube protein n=1 Tax=Streptomyces lavendulae TaxID=1914 RepID=UPI00382C76DE
MPDSTSEDKMADAVLEVYDPPAGNQEISQNPKVSLHLQFRPSELSLTKEVAWVRHNARSAARASVPEFTGSKPRVLSMSVVFDEKDHKGQSVDQRVGLLLSCCVPTSDSLDRDQPSPPLVKFRWGTFASVSFLSFVRSAHARYTRFSTGGEPLRAVCEITLEEIGTTTKGQNPTSGSPSSRQSCVLVRGDSLQSVAVRNTGRASDWRAIAELNDIDDPSKVAPGRVLLLPDASPA